MTPVSFRKIVWSYYRTRGRHDLPWRKTRNPYKILVSEIMLQQTQVERVIPFYKKFVKEFPTVEKLATAALPDVLKAWQGLGYNRRAKMLQGAAKDIVTRHGGRLPRNVTELESLPGVGPYTARAIAAFAWNEDVVLVETNIRTAILHHFFPARSTGASSPRSAQAARPILHLGKNAPTLRVSDTEIAKVLERLLPKGKSREWYGALMDYGAFLKRSGMSHNKRSATYTAQSAFSGSLREARGAVLRTLATRPRRPNILARILGKDRSPQVRKALTALCAEGLVEKTNGQYHLAN